MSFDSWELTVRLVSGRAHRNGPLVAVGVLKGRGPSRPTDVVVEDRESVVVVESAHEIDHVRHSVGRGLFGLVLPGVVSAAVAPGSQIRPIAGRSVVEVPPRRIFGGQLGQSVGLDPEYGGLLFRTRFGLAAVGALEHRIPTDLQAAMWAWYDEYVSDRVLSEAEFVAEGERIVAELNAVLGDECSFYLDL